MITYQPLSTYADPNYTISYELDGSYYKFTFNYSSIEDRWYIRVETESGEVLVQGVKLVQGISLLQLLTSELAPPGDLLVLPLVTGAGDPGLNDLAEGGTCVLAYVPAT